MLEAQPVVFTSVGETLNIGYEGGREEGEGRWGGEVGRGRGGGEGEGRGRGGGEGRGRGGGEGWGGESEGGEDGKWGRGEVGRSKQTCA